MHYSAKCSLAIARRPSVCPSVTLVGQDHIGWKSWKLIARTISPTPSLFVAQRPSTYFRGTWGNLGETTGGAGKRCGNISKSRTDRDKLLWMTYRNSLALFRTVPSPPATLPFPTLGFLNPHPKLQSLSHERVKLRTSNLTCMFTGSIRT